MKKIASFTVNHDKLNPGLYASRWDGDAVTYDVRMKKPNGGDYLSTGSMHTIEHLFATYVRNSKFSDSIIYCGPMGCRTGFYLIVRDSVSMLDVIKLVKDSMEFISTYEGEIPGASRVECGNYEDHDLEAAKKDCREMVEVLKDWGDYDFMKLRYEE